MRNFIVLFLLASSAVAQPGIDAKGVLIQADTPSAGLGRLGIVADLSGFTNLCIARGYLATDASGDLVATTCQLLDVASGACTVVGDPLDTVTCDATAQAAGHCDAQQDGATIPDLAKCLLWLTGRAYYGLRAEIDHGREIVSHSLKPAASTGDPLAAFVLPKEGLELEPVIAQGLEERSTYHLFSSGCGIFGLGRAPDAVQP